MKASAIMVRCTVPLDMLPPAEREVVSRFLFQVMRGMDAKHDKRWRRMWGRVARGADLAFYNAVARSLPFHRRVMAIEDRLFDNQDGYVNKDRFTDWCKTGAGFGKYELVNGAMKFVPASRSYEECSDDEMREYYDNLMEFLNSPRALKRLWPHLPAPRRMAMLETVLRDPKEQP